MKTLELFKNNISENIVKQYIEYYFNNIIGFKNKIHFKKIDFLPGSYVVILKDDIQRLDKNIGSGVLRQKPWSIFIFNFIDETDYINCFGLNKSYKNIKDAFKAKNFNEIIFDDECNRYKGKYPDYTYKSKEINYFLQNFIYENIYNKNKALFVNSYIYSVYSIFNTNRSIQRNDFNTFYFNTNYKFVQNNYPNIIQQSSDINKTSYIVEHIDEELEGIIKSNKDLLDLVDAYKGNLPLTSVTNYNYNNIINDINKETNYIITEGMARTGKTVIAMRLLNKYPDSNLLLMNYYFYNALRNAFRSQKIEFPQNRIYHHDLKHNSDGGWSKGKKINKKFLIVDEAQRLGIVPALKGMYKSFDEFDEISTIIDYPEQTHTIFLGDNLQKLNPKYDKGLEEIIARLKARDTSYRKYYFDYSIGIPPNVLDSIKYLIIPDYELSSNSSSKYEIKLFDSESKFTEAYKNDKTYKKHISTIALIQREYYGLAGFKHYDHIKMKDFPYFLDKDIKENFLLTPYELISRELDSIYIYLPSRVKANKQGLYFYGDCSYNEYLINQIYVLMTRAKLSLNIYCEDETAHNFLNNKLMKLKENINEYNDEFVSNLTGIELEKANDLEKVIKEKGITRLIHFTSEENIDSIKKNGIMSVSELKKIGLKYDFNDSKRLDNYEDAISLSVQNPNHYLLKRFREKYPNKKYKILIINPAILYLINDKNNNTLAKRIYCNYNAAASNTQKSQDDIEVMFQESYKRFNWHTNNCWSENRDSRKSNEPTTIQAEILFFENIPAKYIMEIKDAE